MRAEVCSPFEWPYVHHHPYPLDEDRMVPPGRGPSKASTISRPSPPADERDAEGSSKVRTSSPRGLERSAGRLVYRVRGSGFLKHMVRNLVGTLIEAGRGNIAELDPLPERRARPRRPRGLFLVNVEYPE